MVKSSYSHYHKAYKKLGLLRRSLCYNNSTSTKKRLYVSLIRSQLLYCSQIWRPYLRKDIKLIENVQRRATKFILNDYSSVYKSRSLKLNLLPLTIIYDIRFFVKSLKQPSTSFNITDFVSFSHNSTRSGSHLKLVHQLAKANSFTSLDFLASGMLYHLWTFQDLHHYCQHIYIKRIFWECFVCNFDQSNINFALSTSVAHALDAIMLQHVSSV